MSDFEEHGFSIVEGVIDDAVVACLLDEVRRSERRGDAGAADPVHARRNLFREMPAVRALAASRAMRSLVEPYLGAECFAVRAIYFDKLPGANWKVPWHQDLSVAVAARRDVDGFGPWSRKAGVDHAPAPASVLERMLTVQLHLDACVASNGPLRILPGTHRHGRLTSERIEALRLEIPEVTCEVGCGGALLMRPLLLHASSAARSPSHRRVIHIEYAHSPLPGGLEWHERVRGSG